MNQESTTPIQNDLAEHTNDLAELTMAHMQGKVGFFGGVQWSIPIGGFKDLAPEIEPSLHQVPGLPAA